MYLWMFPRTRAEKLRNAGKTEYSVRLSAEFITFLAGYILYVCLPNRCVIDALIHGDFASHLFEASGHDAAAWK